MLLASRGFNGISCRTVVLRDGCTYAYTSCQREHENETKPTFGVLSCPRRSGWSRGGPAMLRRASWPSRSPRPGRLGDGPEVVEHHGMHESRGPWTRGDGSLGGGVRTAWARLNFVPRRPTWSPPSPSGRARVAAGLLIRQVGNAGRSPCWTSNAAGVALHGAAVPGRSTRARGRSARPGYRVRVVANGEFIEVFLDDELVLQTVWYGPAHGDVGLLVDRGRRSSPNSSCWPWTGTDPPSPRSARRSRRR